MNSTRTTVYSNTNEFHSPREMGSRIHTNKRISDLSLNKLTGVHCLVPFSLFSRCVNCDYSSVLLPFAPVKHDAVVRAFVVLYWGVIRFESQLAITEP